MWFLSPRCSIEVSDCCANFARLEGDTPWNQFFATPARERLEHNSMDLVTAVQNSVAALGAGIAPIVRVPAAQFWLATRISTAVRSAL